MLEYGYSFLNKSIFNGFKLNSASEIQNVDDIKCS